MVGDYNILEEARKCKGLQSPMTHDQAFGSLFQLIGLKLSMFESLGLRKHNIGELKAWLDFLDMTVNLAVRTGYDDSKVAFADHAFYNHRYKLEEMRKLVEKHYEI